MLATLTCFHNGYTTCLLACFSKRVWWDGTGENVDASMRMAWKQLTSVERSIFVSVPSSTVHLGAPIQPHTHTFFHSIASVILLHKDDWKNNASSTMSEPGHPNSNASNAESRNDEPQPSRRPARAVVPQKKRAIENETSTDKLC